MTPRTLKHAVSSLAYALGRKYPGLQQRGLWRRLIQTRWQDIGTSMPKSVGAIGFPMVVHPRDPDTVWVFPMDGTKVWPRTSVDGHGHPLQFNRRHLAH